MSSSDRVCRCTSAALALAAAITMKAAADEAWVEARSPHFVVVSDAGEGPARETARQFEQLRGLFLKVLPLRVDSARAIVIFAAKDEDGLRALLPHYWEVKGNMQPAGVFIERPDQCYVALRVDARGDSPYDVIYHEYAHFVQHLNYFALPLWLGEGWADFYSGAVIGEQQIRFGRIHPWHIQLLRQRRLLPLMALLTADHDSPYYNEKDRVSVFYAESAALTHYLMVGDDGAHREQLGAYLRLLSEDVDPTEALQRSFGDPKKLEKALDSYVSRLQFLEVRGPAAVEKEQVAVRPLSPAESAAVRGEFLAWMGRPAEARPLIERALELDSNLGPAHRAMGALQLALGQPGEAARSFANAARLSPDSYLAHYWSATIDGVEAPSPEDLRRREQALPRTIELNSLFAPAYASLARLRQSQGGDLQQAFALAMKACELEPTAFNYRLTALSILDAMGDTQARDLLERSLIRSARAHSEILGMLVGYYEQRGRPADAESILRQAKQARPGSVSALSMLARFLRRQKRYDEAEGTFREALAVQPDSAEIFNDLGYMNADRGVKVEEALAFIERALKKEPGNASYLDSRGWALFRLKRLAEAEESLRKAVAKREDPVVLDHLGDVLQERGASEEAVSRWQQALARLPARAEARSALQRKVDTARPRGDRNDKQ